MQGKGGWPVWGQHQAASRAGQGVVSGRLPPGWGRADALALLALLAQARLLWFCKKSRKDADVDSWKWLEDTEGRRLEYQLQPHALSSTYCIAACVRGGWDPKRLSMAPGSSDDIYQLLGTD